MIEPTYGDWGVSLGKGLTEFVSRPRTRLARVLGMFCRRRLFITLHLSNGQSFSGFFDEDSYREESFSVKEPNFTITSKKKLFRRRVRHVVPACAIVVCSYQRVW